MHRHSRCGQLLCRRRVRRRGGAAAMLPALPPSLFSTTCAPQVDLSSGEGLQECLDALGPLQA